MPKRLLQNAGLKTIYAVAMIFGGGLLVAAVLIKALLIEDPQLLELLDPPVERALERATEGR